MIKFGIGLVGYGAIGKVHAAAYRVLPLSYDPLPIRSELVGVCTATESSGLKAIEQADFTFSTTDYRLLLDHPGIQAINICTPNDTHYTLIREALVLGKHIYCDKPLALNVAQAEELTALAKTAPVVAQMTFNYRFVPAILRARQLVEAGFLGDLFGFRVAYLHAGYVDPDRPYSWRMEMARSGGGAIMDLGAHAIDMIRFLTGPGANVSRGGEIEAVRADLQTVIKERRDTKTGEMRAVEVDDIALVQCRLVGGATGTLEASRLATGVQDELRVELHGSRGALKFNLMDPNWLDAYDAVKPEAALGGDRGYTRIECTTRYPKPYALFGAKNTVGWLSFHIQSLFDFINNVARHTDGLPPSPWSPTFEDGLAAQRVIAACQRSATQGGWMPVTS